VKFSIIIPTCNRPEELRRCLETLKGADEIIISDDGDATSTREALRNAFPSVTVVQGPRRGPAANRNCGASVATGDWLVFVDDDCIPEQNLIFAYRLFTTRASVLEGRISPLGLRSRLDMECPANETGGCLWSCNMAIRSDLFGELGGFDESFRGPAMEDVDMRERLRKREIESIFVPDARVWHPWRPRRGKLFSNQKAVSTAYFINKHPDQAPQFQRKALRLNLARRVISHIPRAALRMRSARGLWRELSLSFYEYRMLMKHCASAKTSRNGRRANAAATGQAHTR